MGAHDIAESPAAVSRAGSLLPWLGGGHRAEPGEPHERSAYAVAGAVVLVGALLAWAVAAVALRQSTGWSLAAVLPLALLFGLLVGAVTRGTVGAPHRGRRGIAARAAVALATGVLIGELASLAVFAGPIDHRLDETALRNADSTPAVARAAASLQQDVDARAALDRAVDQAREQQDKALVVARCEYNPTPACPQTRITGVPGPGPETRTANDLLADAQRQLDVALATRDSRAPGLDAAIARERQTLDEARRNAAAGAGRGLGARWVAMNDLAGAGALSLRLATSAACALLCVLPLILGLWRGQTTHDRRTAARAERERAELDADTAIAVKRAEVRREAEILWAEHQLTQARLAVEAQIEIDRERQRRRVAEAIEGPAPASSRREFEPAPPIEPPEEDDMYLPIAAEAEAASRAITRYPAGATDDGTPESLPAPVEPVADVEPHRERATPLIPSLPDATKAAARWVRPLVPPFVARVIDNTTAPLRTARQVFEEVEEITFSLKRTRKVTLDSQATDPGGAEPRPAAAAPGRVASSRGEHARDHGAAGYAAGDAAHASMREISAEGAGRRTLGSSGRDARLELMERDGPRELDAPDGPRQLPPAE
ncbi:DUF4407 domain-containing protein [Mycobacterium sp. Marseille-P9652]|uniref:DUF4407 domain-containing protein n=1 Tax=Mycobacterium sp. Marseille-P9652 TaxID=2654950 RepID=UPI0012E76573|nr:DUF4407 domain-containing protein [Mycobacterium sp. Marseille-P9652]